MRLLRITLSILVVGCGTSSEAPSSQSPKVVQERVDDASPLVVDEVPAIIEDASQPTDIALEKKKLAEECPEPKSSDQPREISTLVDLDGDGKNDILSVTCERRSDSFLSHCAQIRLWIGSESITGNWLPMVSEKMQVVDLDPTDKQKQILLVYPYSQFSAVLLGYSEGALIPLWSLSTSNFVGDDGEPLKIVGKTWTVREVVCRKKKQPKSLCDEEDEDDIEWEDRKALHITRVLTWNGTAVVEKIEKTRAPWENCPCE